MVFDNINVHNKSLTRNNKYHFDFPVNPLKSEMARIPKPSAIQVLTVMVFWGQIQNYMMRTNLSILIVEMVKSPISESSTNNNQTSNLQTCPSHDSNSDLSDATNEGIKEDNKFEWTPSLQGQVLASFSYGYVTTQIIGGRLAEKYGIRKVYGISLFMTGIITFLLPVAAKWDVNALIALRVLQGVFEGVTFPSLHAMTARWIPPCNRNAFIARSYFGSTFGVIFTFPLCGGLVPSYGWECPFYVIGGITAVWFIAWCIFVYDTPDTHPRISPKEREYINSELKKVVNSQETLTIPWKSIATSVPFWGLMITDSANTWGIFTLLTNTPTYMKNVQGLDIKSNGLLSGLPFLFRYIGGITICPIADLILKRNMLSTTNVRRLFNSIGLVLPSVSLVMIAFASSGLECNTTYVIVLLCIAMFFNGAISAGHFSSHVDLAPNFAGTLFGISNTFSGGVVGFVVPLVIGGLLETGSMDVFTKWQIVFSLAAGIYFLGNLGYVLMISGEVQSWNFSANLDGKPQNNTINEEEHSDEICTNELLE